MAANIELGYTLELLKDIAEAWSQRIRSPIIGSVLIAFLIINWKPVWYLLFADRPVRQKFLYFDANTSHASVVWYPIALGLALALALPWIKLLGAWAVRLPTKLLRKIQHDDAQAHKIYQLEKSAEEIEVRARLDAASEEATIAAAKRLEEAEQVGGDELKEEIIEARTPNPETSLTSEPSDFAKKLLTNIASTDLGTFSIYESDGRYKYIIGNMANPVPDREYYLNLRDAVNELRRLGYIENKTDAISLKGYDYLRNNKP